MTLSTIITAALATAGFQLLCPYVFVVNFIPWAEPINRSELQALVQVEQVPRPAVADIATHPAALSMAEQDLGRWRHTGKGHAPRAMLAKLCTGQDIAEVNAYLQKLKPWSVPGSSWELNDGDYDFTETVLIELLYFFGDRPDRLYPESLQHLLDVLLVDEGSKPTLKVPRTFGLLFDTENHLLMTESSRYLKNQWLFTHGNMKPKYNNAANGERLRIRWNGVF